MLNLTGNPKIFLTGDRGIGKSTIIENLLSKLPPKNYGGFFTRPNLENGALKGFEIIDLISGEKAGIAFFAPTGEIIPLKEGFLGVGINSLKNAEKRELPVMDELGFLELCAPDFQKAVFQALLNAPKALGVLRNEPNPFLEQVKAMPGVKIITVNRENREQILAELLEIYL